MPFAIIETGGKHYKVELGAKLQVEKLPEEVGGQVVFDKVLLKSDNKGIQVGTPYIEGVLVEAKVIRQGRAKKKIVFRYKSKTRQRTKKGHRQYFTEVEFTKM